MLLAANVISLIGCILMVAVGFIRKKRTALVVQCVQIGFLATSNLLLNATAGMICGVISIVRNLIFYKTDGKRTIKLLLIGAQLVMTLITWNGTLIEWLPMLSMVIFTWMVDTKSDVVFKLSIIVSQVCWVVYDWHYQNISAFVFDILTILSNTVGIWLVRRAAKDSFVQ